MIESPDPNVDNLGIRSLKREWAKNDFFPTPALMAVKKLGRNICESKIRLLKLNISAAAAQAVMEIHRRLPSFKTVWEEVNNKPLEDKWLQKRIDHQSRKQENKGSHLRLEQVVYDLVADGSVYLTWEQWEEMVMSGLANSALQLQFLYLLSFREIQAPAFTLQKVGITTNLESRYAEYVSRGQRGEYGGIGLWQAKDYLLTCQLGRITVNQAKVIEDKCIAAIGNGKPPCFGKEWFRTHPTRAFEAVLMVLNRENLRPVLNYSILKMVL